MPFPQRIAGALKRYPALTRGRYLTKGFACQGAKFHSPTPLEVHRVVLGRESFYLCGTCRDNLDILTGLMEAAGGHLEWPVMREFGLGIRKLHGRTIDG